MLTTSPRARGEVESGDAGRAHCPVAPTPAFASLWPTLLTRGGGIRKGERRSLVARSRRCVRSRIINLIVIASGAKQSIEQQRKCGLLRSARKVWIASLALA